VAVELREFGDRFGVRAPFPHNQLVITDVDGLFLAKIFEIQRPENRYGIFAGIFL
jgi:hypothetical protein